MHVKKLCNSINSNQLSNHSTYIIFACVLATETYVSICTVNLSSKVSVAGGCFKQMPDCTVINTELSDEITEAYRLEQ